MVVVNTRVERNKDLPPKYNTARRVALTYPRQ